MTSSSAQPTNASPTQPPLRRPVLNEATSVLWRDPHTVQFELGSRRIIVEQIHSEDVLALLPRRRDALDSDEPPSNTDDRDDELAELCQVLAGLGFMSVTHEGAAPLRSPGPGNAGPSGTHRETTRSTTGAAAYSGPNSRHHGRRGAAVAVHGHSQLTALIASVLAASGVGSVRLVANGEASAADACPGGLLPSDEGRRFASAARDAVRRAAPAANLGPDPGGQPSDVVVLTDPGPVDPAVRSALHLDQRTHLSVSVHAGQAIVGPLVVPGLTSCLRCADLHRCDRDPAWPLLAIQLSRTGRRRPPQDAALCVSTAGLAASQILAFLDRQEPASTSATLEWQPPDWRLRRRGWPPHPDCDCGAATPEASTRHNEVVIMR
jgi:hypothetical protein